VEEETPKNISMEDEIKTKQVSLSVWKKKSPKI
jgi:hypothetical protein